MLAEEEKRSGRGPRTREWEYGERGEGKRRCVRYLRTVENVLKRS